MTDDELRQIEEALGMTLPTSYKVFMRDYPQVLLDASVTVEGEDGSYTEGPADLELMNSAEAIISMNKDDPDNYQYSARPNDWPESYLLIGENGCGDVYGIDTAVEDSPVFVGGPHASEYDDAGIADSLSAFADHLAERYQSDSG